MLTVQPNGINVTFSHLNISEKQSKKSITDVTIVHQIPIMPSSEEQIEKNITTNEDKKEITSNVPSTMEGTDVSVSSTSDNETSRKRQRMELSEEQKISKMTDACKTILECIGEDPDREGLVKTPDRWARALLFMTKGYCQRVEDVTNEAIFEEQHDEMVVVRDIDIHSLCEHHMLPFTGKVHVGYIPNGKVLGLSKIARIAEVYARRLQVQERMTSGIADAIMDAISPKGVAVVVDCSHFCMVMRGVQKTGSTTVTSSVRGCFKTQQKTRAEFFSIVQPYRR